MLQVCNKAISINIGCKCDRKGSRAVSCRGRRSDLEVRNLGLSSQFSDWHSFGTGQIAQANWSSIFIFKMRALN